MAVPAALDRWSIQTSISVRLMPVAASTSAMRRICGSILVAFGSVALRGGAVGFRWSLH